MRSTRRAFVIASMVGGTMPLTATLTAARASGAASLSGDAHPLRILPPPGPSTLQGSVARLGGVDLWYWDTGGDQPAIILLHPSTGSGHVWDYQQAVFAAAGYRVIGYSRRGYRGSSAIDPDAPGTGAEDLRLLMDHLKLKSAHIVGTAAGAFTAASFALEWPERVRSLVLACTILSGADKKVLDLVGWFREPWWNSLPHEFRELSSSYRAINRDGVERWKELHQLSRGAHPAANQPAGRPATLSAIAELRMPTLFISGDADLISPPPVARLFASTVRGSRLQVIPECGHSAYWERPDHFNSAILEFLQGKP